MSPGLDDWASIDEAGWISFNPLAENVGIHSIEVKATLVSYSLIEQTQIFQVTV